MDSKTVCALSTVFVAMYYLSHIILYCRVTLYKTVNLVHYLPPLKLVAMFWVWGVPLFPEQVVGEWQVIG